MKPIFFFLIFCFARVTYSQWSEQTSGVTSALFSVSAIDNNTIWACGEGGKVLRTTNSGTTWTIISSPNSTLNLYNILGIDALTALVSGTGSDYVTRVYKTSNGGLNWSQTFSQQGGFVNAIRFIFGNTYGLWGDPVEGRWTVFLSFDGGMNWDSTGWYVLQATGESGWNNSIYIDKGSFLGWMGTTNSRLYKGAGGSYIILPTPGLVASFAVWGNSDSKIMTGGAIMLYSTNGGTNWTNVNAIGTGEINGITGEGFKWWYVRGSSVYYSSNDGSNWSSAYTSTGTYNHISKPESGGNMWAVKSNGGISKYNSVTGVQTISNEIPKEFLLYQNYPNPFNPSTKIKFSLPEGNKVSIGIYDALGSEVTHLIDEYLKSGTYEINWDASGVSSGIYYYKLITGEFSESKKMILLR